MATSFTKNTCIGNMLRMGRYCFTRGRDARLREKVGRGGRTNFQSSYVVSYINLQESNIIELHNRPKTSTVSNPFNFLLQPLPLTGQLLQSLILLFKLILATPFLPESFLLFRDFRFQIFELFFCLQLHGQKLYTQPCEHSQGFLFENFALRVGVVVRALITGP